MAMTADRAAALYDVAREDVASKMRTMVEQHDHWHTVSGADQSHPATAAITAERWARFQQASDAWQQAMAMLRVARRRYERLQGQEEQGS